MDSISITKPDDWHLHLRDGEMLAAVVSYSAQRCQRAIVMPNLANPVTTTEAAKLYRNRIIQQLPDSSTFQPLMTIYLTDITSIEEIEKAHDSGFIYAAKLYPSGATTNSDSGVSNIVNIYPVLEKMAKIGMPLLVHGEVTNPEIDVFDRESYFIEQVLSPLVSKVPELKIVLEHITTATGVEFVLAGKDNIAATITPQHLLLNRNAILVGGIHPHNYCLPVLKREEHRVALVAAATGGNKKFFAGTDSAPHLQHLKESSCGCAGIFTAHASTELYAEVFESAGKLENLEKFISHNGADFYGLPRNKEQICLKKESWQVPDKIQVTKTGSLRPFRAGEEVRWSLC